MDFTAQYLVELTSCREQISLAYIVHMTLLSPLPSLTVTDT